MKGKNTNNRKVKSTFFATLRKHPIVSLFITMLVIFPSIVGWMQAAKWTYDNLLHYQDPFSLEKSIFLKVAPGNSMRHLETIIGPARKKIPLEYKENSFLHLWRLKGIVLFSETFGSTDEIVSFGALSDKCEYSIEIPQIWFNLCSDGYGEPYNVVPWSGFYGAQSAGYLERSGGTRAERYYTIFKGSSTEKLINIEEMLYETNDNNEIQTLVSEISEQHLGYRKIDIPNFFMMTTGDIHSGEVLWNHFTTVLNFSWYND